MATGNNVSVDTDLARRTVVVGLDAEMEHPASRDTSKMRHPRLIDWAEHHRGALVEAALVLVMAWIARGRPSGTKLIGSFERWCEVLGGVLTVAGVEGFLGNYSEQRDQLDEDAAAWRKVCWAWWRRFKSEVVGTKDLFELIREDDLLPWLGTSADEGNQRKKLGKVLSKKKGCWFGPFRIVSSDKDNSRRNQYRLEPAADFVAPDGLDPDEPAESQISHRCDKPPFTLWDIAQNYHAYSQEELEWMVRWSQTDEYKTRPQEEIVGDTLSLAELLRRDRMGELN
jgi:hypothetical protein